MREDLNWELISQKKCFNSKWFDIISTAARLPNGAVIDDYYVINNQDAVMIVALDKDENILLKQEYRLPVNKVLLELPAGAIESHDQSPLEAAKRELLEETGYSSENWTYLGCTYDCPDRCTAKLHLYLARDIEHISRQHLDKTEVLNVCVVKLTEAFEMCFTGEIEVNSCIHGIMKTMRLLDTSVKRG